MVRGTGARCIPIRGFGTARDNFHPRLSEVKIPSYYSSVPKEIAQRGLLEIEIFLISIEVFHHEIIRDCLRGIFFYCLKKNQELGHDQFSALFKALRNLFMNISLQKTTKLANYAKFNNPSFRKALKLIKVNGFHHWIPHDLEGSLRSLPKLIDLINRRKLPPTVVSGLMNPFNRIVIDNRNESAYDSISKIHCGDIPQAISELNLRSSSLRGLKIRRSHVPNENNLDLMKTYGKNALSGPKLISILADISYLILFDPCQVRNVVNFMKLYNRIFNLEVYNIPEINFLISELRDFLEVIGKSELTVPLEISNIKSRGRILIHTIESLTNSEITENYAHLLDNLIEYIKVTYNPPLGHTGKLVAFNERFVKTRVIAIIDSFSEYALLHFHKVTMNVLGSIPQDYTYNQDNIDHDLMSNTHLQVFADHSEWTDRLNVNLVAEVLNQILISSFRDKEILIRKFSKSWAQLLSGREYFCRRLKVSHLYSGTPMGGISGWSCSALFHHYFVRLCYQNAYNSILNDSKKFNMCHLINLTQSSNQYGILGDDMRATDLNYDPEKNPEDQLECTFTYHYLKLAKKFGLSISIDKSHFPQKFGGKVIIRKEFGKRIGFTVMGKSTMVSPIDSGKIVDIKDFSGCVDLIIKTIIDYIHGITQVKEAWRICSSIMINFIRRENLKEVFKGFNKNLRNPIPRRDKEFYIKLFFYILYRVEDKIVTDPEKNHLLRVFIDKLFTTVNYRNRDCIYYAYKFMGNSVLQKLKEIECAKMMEMREFVDPSEIEILSFYFLLFPNFDIDLYGKAFESLYKLVRRQSENSPLRLRSTIESRLSLESKNSMIFLDQISPEIQLTEYSSVWDRVINDQSYTNRELEYRKTFYRKFTTWSQFNSMTSPEFAGNAEAIFSIFSGRN